MTHSGFSEQKTKRERPAEQAGVPGSVTILEELLFQSGVGVARALWKNSG
jgi:hypothetical protein